jgi:hypothetical protein
MEEAMKKSAQKAELSGAIASLKQKRDVMLALDGRMSDEITGVEDALRSLKLSVPFAICIEKDPKNQYSEWLSFEKYEGKWRLTISSGPDDEPDLWSTKPLANCSREKRYDAVNNHLFDLVTKAVEDMDRQIHEREQAVEKAGLLRELLAQADGKEGE